MSRRCIGYEGEGRARRPIYEDQGPASGRGRASTPGGHAEVARIAHAEASKLIEVGGRMPSGGASAIERRMATEAQRAHWRSPPAEDSPIAPVPISEAARRLAAAHRGGAVNRVKTTTGLDLREARAIVDRDPLITLADSPVTPVTPVTPEEPVMAIEPSPPVIARSPESQALADLTAATSRVDAAWDAFHAADTARILAEEEYELARRDLARAMATVNQAFVLPDVDLELLDRLTHPAPIARSVDSHSPSSEPHYHDAPEAVRPDWLDDPVADAPEVVTQRPAAAGGGPGVDGLTRRQAEVLEVVLRHDGDRRKASSELRIAYQSIDVTLEAIGKRGLLPAALIPKLPARFAQFTGV